MDRAKTSNAGSAGPSTDKDNHPVVDPTANVLQLVEAAVDRLNDLADARAKHMDERLAAMVENIKELMTVRDTYMTRLAEAEAKRIDAIRAVDVNAVAVASDRAAQQATVLANQVASSAETLRALVAQTAKTIADSLEQSNRQSEARLAALEKAQYETQGRGMVANPAELLKEIQLLRESRAGSTGESDQSKAILGYIIGGLGLLIAAVAVVVSLTAGP